MPTRPLALMLLALVVALLVCSSSIWLLPDGQGSFSAVHGPISHLKAWRDGVRVLSGIRRIFVVALLAGSAIGFFAGRAPRIADSAPPVSARLSLLYVLTC